MIKYLLFAFIACLILAQNSVFSKPSSIPYNFQPFFRTHGGTLGIQIHDSGRISGSFRVKHISGAVQGNVMIFPNYGFSCNLRITLPDKSVLHGRYKVRLILENGTPIKILYTYTGYATNPQILKQRKHRFRFAYVLPYIIVSSLG